MVLSTKLVICVIASRGASSYLHVSGHKWHDEELGIMSDGTTLVSPASWATGVTEKSFNPIPAGSSPEY